MKKFLKFLFVLIIILTAIKYLFLQFAVPPIAAALVEKHSKEYIGRQVTIGEFSWVLHSLDITLKDVKVYEQDDSTEFVGFDYLNVNVSPIALISKTAKLENLTLEGLRATVLKSGDRFNFTDILEFLASNSTDTFKADSLAADTTAQQPQSADSSTVLYSNPIPELPLAVELNNINISNVKLHYKDLQSGMDVQVEKAGVHIPQVHLDSTLTDVKIEASFPAGGNVDLAVKFGIASGDFAIDLNLNKFALENAFSIAKNIVQIDSLSGDLSVGVQTAGNLNTVLASDIKGSVKLADLSVREKAGGRYSVKNLETGFAEINLEKNRFPVDSLVIYGVNGHFDMFKGGKTNIDKLLNASTEEVPVDSSALSLVATNDTVAVIQAKADTVAEAKNESPAAKQELPYFLLKKLSIRDVAFSLNDYTIVQPMHYTVNNVSVEGKDISMKNADIKVHVNFQESGALDLDFHGVPEQLMTMKIASAKVAIDMKNMALKPFSPYSVHYTGYPLVAGTMNVNSSTTITNNNLKSVNSVLIDKITVADKDKSVKPEFSVPMKIGLYVLKDRHDQIKIDMPVEGSLDDPKFSVGKVIWNTFCNLMVKVALTPTKLIVAPIDALTGQKDEEKAAPSK